MTQEKNEMGGMSDMMSKMMGGGSTGPGMGMPMMTKMIPAWLSMVMGKLPKEQGMELAKEITAVMVEHGYAEPSKKE